MSTAIIVWLSEADKAEFALRAHQYGMTLSEFGKKAMDPYWSGLEPGPCDISFMCEKCDAEQAGAPR